MNWPEATVTCVFMFFVYRLTLNLIWRGVDEQR